MINKRINQADALPEMLQTFLLPSFIPATHLLSVVGGKEGALSSPRLDELLHRAYKPLCHSFIIHTETVLAVPGRQICIYRWVDKTLIIIHMFQIYHLLNVAN